MSALSQTAPSPTMLNSPSLSVLTGLPMSLLDLCEELSLGDAPPSAIAGSSVTKARSLRQSTMLAVPSHFISCSEAGYWSGTVYAFMQSVGMVNDHLLDCFARGVRNRTCQLDTTLVTDRCRGLWQGGFTRNCPISLSQSEPVPIVPIAHLGLLGCNFIWSVGVTFHAQAHPPMYQ